MVLSASCYLGLVCMSLTSIVSADLLPDFADLIATKALSASLHFTQLAAIIELVTEEHEVETEDGYLLRMFRVRKRGCQVQGVPVVLNHGLLLDAACWIAAGELSPAYLVASTCTDLWLPNQRGTRYSLKHTTLATSDKEFWNFCVDEIGRYDIPAFIDYVILKTGVEKVNYIGFSQACGTFFIMCSERPEYSQKIGVMVALAPATRHLNSKSVPFRLILDGFKHFESILQGLGIYDAFAVGGPTKEFLENVCAISDLTLKVCDGLNNLLGSDYDLHPGSVNKETLKAISMTFPSSTSVHNLARYGQSIYLSKFQKFDYGITRNLKLYGSVIPPEYNLGAVETPTVVIYGVNDGITDVVDVEWSIDQLPRVLEAMEVDDPLWNHFDMTFSKDFKVRIFPTIKKHLNLEGNKMP